MNSRKPKSCQKCTIAFPDVRERQTHRSMDQLSQKVGTLQIRPNDFPENRNVNSLPSTYGSKQNRLPSFACQQSFASLNPRRYTFPKTSSESTNSNKSTENLEKRFALLVINSFPLNYISMQYLKRIVFF